MDPSALISALAPVLLILALGFAAGKHHSFDSDQARGLSHLALGYALPAALFLAMAHFKRSTLLEQGPLALSILLGYSGFYLLLYWLLRRFRYSKLEAALLGYTLASTTVPIYGLTVLGPLYGDQVAGETVGLFALITVTTQVPVALLMMQSAASQSAEHPTLAQSFLASAKNPLIWAPVLGLVVALSGESLSPYVTTALQPLAAATSGVAIFCTGLVLAAHRFTLSPIVIIGSIIILALRPALLFAGLHFAQISGPLADAAFVASASSTAVMSVLFAQQFKTAQAETASIALITTLGMIVAVPLAIVATTML